MVTNALSNRSNSPVAESSKVDTPMIASGKECEIGGGGAELVRERKAFMPLLSLLRELLS